MFFPKRPPDHDLIQIENLYPNTSSQIAIEIPVPGFETDELEAWVYDGFFFLKATKNTSSITNYLVKNSSDVINKKVKLPKGYNSLVDLFTCKGLLCAVLDKGFATSNKNEPRVGSARSRWYNRDGDDIVS